ncbi:MAG: S1 RNA-binding domain-containing protein, partial [Pseudomonadota bacterium]
ELEKPGRDPRPSFKMAHFRDDIAELKDLKPDMILEGVVTNVTRFGAFVDIGVHQDGLVHISSLANRFVKNPQDCVKAGDIVKVKVLEVDLNLKRIQLSMRLEEESKSTTERTNTPNNAPTTQRKNPNQPNTSAFKPRPAPTGKPVSVPSKKTSNNAKRPPEKPKVSQPVANKATYSLALAFSSVKLRSDKRDDSPDEL